MNTVTDSDVLRLQDELAQRLGYVPEDDDPVVALAYVVKQIQEDQHEALLETLTQVQTVSRTLTADGREQITQYASELGRRLGNELRLQVRPDAIASDIVSGCAPGISAEVAASIQGHLDNHANVVSQQMRQAMAQHDENLFWHVDRRLDVHTRIGTRNTIAQIILTVVLATMAACMLSASHSLYESTRVHLPTEQERIASEPPPSLVPPPVPQIVPDGDR